MADEAIDISSEAMKLFISDKGGATRPGSVAVNAFTEGYTLTPMLRASDCMKGQVWFCFGCPHNLHRYLIFGWSDPDASMPARFAPSGLFASLEEGEFGEPSSSVFMFEPPETP